MVANQWTGVILAAGQGTRMRSSLPKPLHRVCGKTMLEHVIGMMRSAGAGQVVVVVGPSVREMPALSAAVGDGVSIAVQERPAGTADALEAARGSVGSAGTMVVAAADMSLLRPRSLCDLLDGHAADKARLTMLTAKVADPFGLGRVIRDGEGRLTAVVEEADATGPQKTINEINTGLFCLDAAWAWKELKRVGISPSGEKYLPDLIAAAAETGGARAALLDDPAEALGVNDRVQLAQVEQVMRDRIRRQHMLEGVTIRDPGTTYIEADVEIGRDTELLPGTHLFSGTRIGEGCEIGPNSIVHNSAIGDRSKVISSYLEGAEIESDTSVGPYSRIRPGTVIGSGAYIGNYAEIKNSRIGPGSHVGHFSYVGDAELGVDVNIGAGTVTANYDGSEKHRTEIDDRARIGSDTIIVAPVKIGKDVYTGAGSVVTKDVGDGETVVGVPARPMTARKSESE